MVVHAEKGVIADQFYAERLYTRDQIKDLLESAGFGTVRFFESATTDSTRDQDLGMMAHRMFLTSRAPREVSLPTRNSRAPVFSEITVIMGDPNLSDPVKREGQFNAEDFETIQKLKDALNELPGYKYKYISNHVNLMNELRDNPPQFVFNLCDEGYMNDPFMELHVPAMMEMLGIPYTGAGPASLGLCYNKALVNGIAQTLDIPVPLETFFNPDDQSATLPSVLPALVKPNTGDSSMGITQKAVVYSAEELIAYIDDLRALLPGRALLIQEYLTGPEYSVGIIGNPGLTSHVLPVPGSGLQRPAGGSAEDPVV